MSFDFPAVRDLLQEFEFASVFREHLGWSRPPGATKWAPFRTVDGDFERREIAELSGVAVFEVHGVGGAVPKAKARAGIHKVIAAHHHEHLLIFVDHPRRTQSLWSWMRRGEKREQARTHYFFKGQPGDRFLCKLDAMIFDLADFDADGRVLIVDASRKLRNALDVEQVTERFFEELQQQHRRLVGQIEGIRDERDRRWYASVLLNRLMFVYFLQRKNFVDGDLLYLQNRLAKSKVEGVDRYYPDFLALLFFEGFAKPEDQRSPAARARLGRVRYLNGGLFLPHAIEQRNTINVPDQAFDDIYALFERYTWNLDDTPGGDDREINPHVLGFTKYINDQKASGAYYTRPELTAYLCEQTIHRLVLDGVNEEDVSGLSGSGPGGQPRRFEDIADLLLNLDARLCWRLLDKVLPGLKLLDPACGSGAFLVAAAEELRELYGAVVGQAKVLRDAKLKAMVAEWERRHKSLGYFLKKRIITQNLFGVDLNEEATEIARLRLFLALVASANDEKDLEDIELIKSLRWSPEFDDVIQSKGGFDVVLADLGWGHQGGGQPRLDRIFVERCYRLLRDKGQFGLILPAAAYHGEGSKKLREMLLEACTLRAIHGFAKERAAPVCVLVGGKGGTTSSFFATFGVPWGGSPAASCLGEFLRDHQQQLVLTADLVRRTSPASLTVMEFKSALDLPVIERMLHHPMLGDEVNGTWSIDLCQGVSVYANRPPGRPTDSARLLDERFRRGTPVYARDAIYPYEWRAEKPRLRLGPTSTIHRLGYTSKYETSAYLLGLVGVPPSRAGGRTLVGAIMPPGSVVDDSVTVLRLHPDARDERKSQGFCFVGILYVVALFNSYVVDWIVRMRVFRHLSVSHVRQLPLPRLTPKDPRLAPISLRAAQLTCTTPEFDALAKEVGLKSHAAGETHPERRSALRAEIDGLVAHLYGLTEEEFVHILKSFPVVPEPQRVAAHNAYRDVARGRFS